MTKIIGNCVSILVLSSALPVMSRTLGITRFDLLGDFGRFNWLGNFYIVLSYNLLFAIVTTLCLVRKFTSAVREELFKALGLHKLHLSDTSRDSETSKPSANGHHKALWDTQQLSAIKDPGAPHSRHPRRSEMTRTDWASHLGPGPGSTVSSVTSWELGCRKPSPLAVWRTPQFPARRGSVGQHILLWTHLLASVDTITHMGILGKANLGAF